MGQSFTNDLVRDLGSKVSVELRSLGKFETHDDIQLLKATDSSSYATEQPSSEKMLFYKTGRRNLWFPVSCVTDHLLRP